jgi:hypothetical protein
MTGLFSVMGRSLRGLRLVEAFALLMLLMMVLGNYLAKASAGRERGDITSVESQIGDEQRRLRLLDAEVAHLEQPERMERLSAIAGLGPTSAKHEGTLDQLPEIASGALIADKTPHKDAVAGAPSDAAAAPKAVVVASAPTRGGAPQ